MDGVGPSPRVRHKRRNPDQDERAVIWLEFAAAAAIFAIMALVLYTVFTFKPA
jgi:hypothetical protein